MDQIDLRRKHSIALLQEACRAVAPALLDILIHLESIGVSHDFALYDKVSDLVDVLSSPEQMSFLNSSK